MDWIKLFSSRRIGVKRRKMPGKIKEGRSEFQRDFDRVIFAPSFRHLQSKTQVVPLPVNDFVHTRLTHSLEASCVGRSLGRIVGDRIIQQDPAPFEETGVTSADFESVVATACLAHDIGNPPFGHSGEEAIGEFFSSAKAQAYIEELTDAERADLQNFEGNAAGFRLLTYTAPTHSEVAMGIGLTFATLGTFTKYPKGSLPKLKSTGNASERKFGFFQSEKEIFREIAEDLDLPEKQQDVWYRHPLAFLVEAADDICYSIIDFEDGYKLGRLDFNTVEACFLEIIGEDISRFERRYKEILDFKEKAGFLRSIAINHLVGEAANIFTDNLAEIMNGDFDKHLIELGSANQALKEISAISVERLYRAEPVVIVEVAGFEVLSGLLGMYLGAVFNDKSPSAKMIRHLIPDVYFDIGRRQFSSHYQRIINIAMYVASMTDTYAVSTFRQLKGISI